MIGIRGLFERINNPDEIITELKSFYDADVQTMRSKIAVEFPKIIMEDPEPVSKVHRVHFLKTAWFRYAAAIIILFGVGAYLWNSNKNEESLVQHTERVQEKNDIAPGSTRAVLTLADGSKIVLDSVINGKLSEQNGSIVIKKEDGRLVYEVRDHVWNNKQSVTYNTMSTPRGGAVPVNTS